MRHTEFFNDAHFTNNYFRVKPSGPLSFFIDFFWQTKFDHLWKEYPDNFSDMLFPNIGYSYLVNIGTPFTMQINEKKFTIKNDSFLPRHNSIECHHQPGNKIFGIKFRISPVVFEKKVNFSEYRQSMTPLSYLMDKHIVALLKTNIPFEERVSLLEEYFTGILENHNTNKSVHLVSSIISDAILTGNFSEKIENLAGKHQISARTLQRYFEQYTSSGCKETFQILRARKVMESFMQGKKMDLKSAGFYDYSHFYKYMKSFLGVDIMQEFISRMKNSLAF